MSGFLCPEIQSIIAMQYKVFTDFHHGSLLQSLILLFEKRLGGELYRPIGLEWFEQGYWKINDQRDTAEQFLSPGSIPSDGTPPLNTTRDHTLSFADFFNTKIDIVIASIPQHLEPFRRLCELHPNKPKLIYQIGNQWDFANEQYVRNFMVSASITNTIPEGANVVEYHQEFDLDLFRPDRLTLTDVENDERVLTYPAKNIYSFINCFNTQQHFAGEWEIFQQVEQLLPDWQLRSFGGQCRDGNMTGALDLARKMCESRFVWHTKSGGDGFGHILHNSAAVGRPVIIRRSDYVGKLGEKLLIKDETCIEIDGLTPSQIVEKIRYFSEPERYMRMCRNVYWNFTRVVDYDREQKKIEAFLSRLV